MEFKSCVEACRRCADACESCANNLSREPSSNERKVAISTATDCAQFCRTTAGFLERESRFAMNLCGLCAEVCDACVDRMRKIG